MTRRVTHVVPIPQEKLQRMLIQSVAHAKVAKLARQVVELEEKVKAGRIGPRVMRARARFLETERKRLLVEFRRMGFKGLE